MHIIQNNIFTNEETRTKRVKYPYICLAVLSALVVTFNLFTGHGLVGVSLLLLMSTVAVFGILVFLQRPDRRDDAREKEAQSFIVALLISILLLGEFGSSTESSITFFVNIWKLLILVLVCFVVRIDSARNFASLRSIAASPVAAAFVLAVGSLLLSVVLQLIVLDANVKGCIRAITFYGSLLMALYCSVGLLRQRADFVCARTVFRCVLLVLVGFAIFEMISGFHLPTSWLNGDDPTALAKQEQIAGRGIWMTATGLCYNQNDFCLILAIVGCLSLPSRDEPRFRIAAALVLVALDLALVAALGSTIVSMGMLLAAVLWGFAFRWRLCCKIAWASCMTVCVFFISEILLAQIGILAE